MSAGAVPTVTGTEPIKIFIGYDHRQPVAFTVLTRSIVARTRQRVAIEPIMLDTLPLKRQGLTPFTFSRFLVPWMCDYKGWALFLDADMQVLADISELWALRDPSKAVQVVLHKDTEQYEAASVMLFNCEHPANRVLTPHYIEAARSPLHRIGWIDDPAVIGELPRDWNFLVGYEQPRKNLKLLHYTMGVPVWPETQGDEFTQIYSTDASSAMQAEPWINLMGNSVHAKHVYKKNYDRRVAAEQEAARQRAALAAASQDAEPKVA